MHATFECALLTHGIPLFSLCLQTSVSHMSHLGGLLCGLMPAFIILPNLKWERWEVVLPVLGGMCIAAFFVVLPVWLYVQAFPDMKC